MAGLWIALSACATSAPQQMVPADARIDDDTTLSAGDTFEVTIYGENDLSGKYRVSEDGSINFPLVGKLFVETKSTVEVADMIRKALVENKILLSPNVSVYMVERRTKQISMMGAVSKPGSYQLTAGMSLIQALGAAGGLTPLARGSESVLTRIISGQRQRFRVDLESITEGRAADIALQAGDIVYVPERVF